MGGCAGDIAGVGVGCRREADAEAGSEAVARVVEWAVASVAAADLSETVFLILVAAAAAAEESEVASEAAEEAALEM